MAINRLSWQHCAQQQSSELVLDSSSDGDAEWHEADYTFLASEIPFLQIVTGPEADQWKNAIYDEMKSLVTNDTWNLVEKSKDGNIVKCRTVLTNKYRADSSLEKRKARIITKGFLQRPGIDFRDTFAPVARLGSVRLLIALSAQFGMYISQLDVTSA